MIDTTANVVISKANEVFLTIDSEPHIEYELRDHFTFEVEGAKFMPQYRKRNWNGEIHLFDKSVISYIVYLKATSAVKYSISVSVASKVTVERE